MQILSGKDQEEIGHVLHDEGGGTGVLQQPRPDVARNQRSDESRVSLHLVIMVRLIKSINDKSEQIISPVS